MHRRDPNVWLWTRMAGGVSGPAFGRAVRVRRETSRSQFCFSSFCNGKSSCRPPRRTRGRSPRDEHRPVSRSGAGHRPIWRRSVGLPAVLSPPVAAWARPRRTRAQRPGLGFSSAQSRSPSRQWLSVVRAIHPQRARRGGALRIDHVMRFFRLCWIPEGFETSQGAYVPRLRAGPAGRSGARKPARQLHRDRRGSGNGHGRGARGAGRSGHSELPRAVVRARRGGQIRPPERYPRARRWCATTTHDLPTLAGFSAGRDIEARRAAGLVDEAEYRAQKAHRAGEVGRLEEALRRAGFEGDPLGFLLSTPCVLAMINQEDLRAKPSSRTCRAAPGSIPTGGAR